MAKATNINSAGYSAPRQTVDINGLKLLPKIDTSQQTTGNAMGNNNTLGGKIGTIFGNLKTAYNKNPDLYNMLGTALGQVALSIPGGIENNARRHNLITASYFKNPYLISSLPQPYNYSEYFADYLNNQYLNKKAKEEEEEKKRKELEEDTDRWYDEYVDTNIPEITSGGNVPPGLDAMGRSINDFIKQYNVEYPVNYGGYDDTTIS